MDNNQSIAVTQKSKMLFFRCSVKKRRLIPSMSAILVLSSLQVMGLKRLMHKNI